MDARLRQLTTLLQTKDALGLSSPSLLGLCSYEPRSLAVLNGPGNRSTLFAGDKSGQLYRADVDVGYVPPRSRFTMFGALGSADRPRSIDCIVPILVNGRQFVVAATRGAGVWILEVGAWDDRSSSPPQLLTEREPPHGRLLFADDIAQEIWCSVQGKSVARFGLDGDTATWRETGRWATTAPISAHALDRAADPMHDHLYLATLSGDIVRLRRGEDRRFALDLDVVHSCANDWRQLIPLCRYGEKHRGVVAVALRHVNLLLLGNTGLNRTQSREFQEGITAVSGLRSDRGPVTVVATMDGKLHMLRGHDVDRDARIAHLDGPCSSFNLGTVAFALVATALTPGEASSHSMFMGLANHRVEVWSLALQGVEERLREQARGLLKAQPTPFDALAAQLRRHPFDQTVKRVALLLLEESVTDPASKDWQTIAERTLYAVLYGAERLVVFEAISLLEMIARSHPEVALWASESATFARKFCLLGGTYTAPKNRRLQIARYNERNTDDCAAYVGICAYQGFDPMFRHDFIPEDEFGEVRCLVPLDRRPERLSEAPPEATRSPATPETPWFLATTYRGGVWLLCASARKRIAVDRSWGTARNIFLGRDAIYFAFSEVGVRTLSWQSVDQLVSSPEGSETVVTLNSLPGMSASIVSLCPSPDGSAEAFVYGTADGRVGMFDGTELLHVASKPDQFGWPIWDLRSFLWDGRSHLLAAVGDGNVHLLRWNRDPVSSTVSVESVDVLPVGESGALCLILPDKNGFFTVGTESGKVYGVALGVHDGRTVLRVRWAYRAGDAVRNMHRYPAMDTPGTDVVIVGSLDCHLHVLDADGRVRGTYFLPGFPVARFVVRKPGPEMSSPEHHCLVIACAFENRFWGISILDRRRVRARLDSIASKSSVDQQTQLLRWRAMQLGSVGEFVLRQAIHTPIYGHPTAVMDDLEALLGSARYSETTETVVALVRRMFANENALNAILADDGLHQRMAILFEDIRAKWDVPASGPHRKVQLYWIRSLLRAIRSRDTWTTWIESSELLASKSGRTLASAEAQLRYFLTHGSAFIQFKSLQYLERLLLGWPASGTVGIFRRDTTTEHDVSWVLDLLISRLQLKPSDVRVRAPNWVILQVGRLLLGLMARGVLCPAYLTQRLSSRMNRVESSAEFLELLAGQALASTPALRDVLPNVAQYLSHAADLIRSLCEPVVDDTAIRCLGVMDDHCRTSCALNCPFAAFRDAHRSVIPATRQLLAARTLEAMAAGSRSSTAVSGGEYFKCDGLLGAFAPLVDALSVYRRAKLEDAHVRPFQALEYHSFHDVVHELRQLRAEIDIQAPSLPQLDRLLLHRLVAQWGSTIEEERDHHLVTDFLTTLRDHVIAPVYRVPERERRSNWVEEPDATLAAAFRNLFVRFALLGEPSSGWFLFHDRRDESVHSIRLWADRIEERSRPQALAEGLPEDWFARDLFLDLSLEALEAHLGALEPAAQWHVLSIRDPMPGGPGNIGFYAFRWSGAHDQFGWRRIDNAAQGFLWAAALLHSLTEQRMLMSRFFSVVAHNIKQPVFTIRSLAGDLCSGRLQDRRAREEDHFADIHGESRRIMGIVDGMLALRGRQVEVSAHRTPLRSLVDEVCRAATKLARSYNSTVRSGQGRKEVYVKADPDCVYNILRNLVENGLKYSPEKSEVEVRLDMDQGGGATVSVQDQGYGIPKDDLDKIYTAYFRGRMAEKHKIAGLGLGLYTCSLYAKLLGLKLLVESSVGEGSKFTLVFPKRLVESE